MTDRPTDIASPIDDPIQPLQTSPEDVRRTGRVAYEKPTPDNAIVLLIDDQIGLMAGVRDMSSQAEYRSNVVGLARTAKALTWPLLISSSNAQWQNGDTLPEIEDLFPDEPLYQRTGIIDAYQEPRRA